MRQKRGLVAAVNGNMVSVMFEGDVAMNEVAYILSQEKKLKSEVIRIRGNEAQVQVFEMTKGIRIGDEVEFSEEMLSVELGPGLLGQIYDGLQNPLPEIAEKTGYFLESGVYLKALSRSLKWMFTPSARVGDLVHRGDVLGSVPERHFVHKIMLPFNLFGEWKITSIADEGEYTIDDTIAIVEDGHGIKKDISMTFSWPVKKGRDCNVERLKPEQPMFTRNRIIDTFFPVPRVEPTVSPVLSARGKPFFSR